MAVCRQCGSIKTQVIHGSTLERIIARALGQRVLFCGRCGWRGRARTLPDAPTSHTVRRRRRHATAETEPPREPVSDLDLDALDEALGSEPPRGLSL